jgi:hypothetical protein
MSDIDWDSIEAEAASMSPSVGDFFSQPIGQDPSLVTKLPDIVPENYVPPPASEVIQKLPDIVPENYVPPQADEVIQKLPAIVPEDFVAPPSLAEVFKEPVQADEEAQVHDEVFTQEGAEASLQHDDQIKIDLNQTTDWEGESTRIADDMSRQHRMEAGETLSQGILEPGIAGMGARLLGASNPVTAAASFIPALHRKGQVSEEGKAILDHPEDPRYGQHHLLGLGDRIIRSHENRGPGWNPTIPETGIQIPIGRFAGSVNEALAKTSVGAGRALDAVSPATLSDAIKARNFNPHGMPIDPETGLPKIPRASFGPAEEIRKPQPTTVMQDINSALNYPAEPGWLQRTIGPF